MSGARAILLLTNKSAGVCLQALDSGCVCAHVCGTDRGELCLCPSPTLSTPGVGAVQSPGLPLQDLESNTPCL
jgi:hypothetical protein